MKRCNECSVSILSGSYCSLCAKAMISTNNNVSMEAISMKNFKSKLVIKDLAFESAKLYFKESICSSIANEEENELYYSHNEEFDISEEDLEKQNNELALLGVHEGTFLAAQEKPLTDLAKAKAIVETEGYSTKEMSDELVLEMARHFLDAESTDNGEQKYAFDSKVYVKVQRLSAKGNWYNVKETLTKAQKEAGVEAQVLSFAFDLEDLFVLNDSNDIEDLKYINGKPALYKAMEELKFKTFYLKPVKDESTGVWDYVTCEQRFFVSSTAFNEFTTIAGQQFDDFSASFNYKVVNGKVVKEKSTWSYDNMLTVDAMAFMAIKGIDNTSAYVDEKKYQQGIMTGKSVATKAMMYDDMKKVDSEAMAQEEKANTKSIKNAQINKLRVDYKTEMTLANPSAPYVISLIERSLAIESAHEFNDLIAELETNIESLSSFLTIARAYRKVSGKQFEYTVFTKIQAMISRNETLKTGKIKQDLGHIIENIESLNNGQISVHEADFDDEIALEIFEAAIKYGREKKEFFIKTSIFPELHKRVKAIKKATKVA